MSVQQPTSTTHAHTGPKQTNGEDTNIGINHKQKQMTEIQTNHLFKHTRTHDNKQVNQNNQCNGLFEGTHFNSTDSIHHVEYDATFQDTIETSTRMVWNFTPRTFQTCVQRSRHVFQQTNKSEGDQIGNLLFRAKLFQST